MRLYLVLVVVLLECFCGALCRNNGAPETSCFYMTPRHRHPYTDRRMLPTHARGLYNITVSADIFRPDRPVRVTLWGPPFKGFMMAGVEEGSKDWPTGIFYSEDGAAKRLGCLGYGDTVTHTNNSYKDEVSVLWYGPENFQAEQIQFVATVVVNLTIYYINIRSQFIRLDPTVHQAALGGGESPIAVTGDPWLSGSAITQAPWLNLWGQGGQGQQQQQQQQQQPSYTGWAGTNTGTGWNTGTGAGLWNSGTAGTQWNTGTSGWDTGGNQPATQQDQHLWNQPLAASLNWNQAQSQPNSWDTQPADTQARSAINKPHPWAAEIARARETQLAAPAQTDASGSWGTPGGTSGSDALLPTDTAAAPGGGQALGLEGTAPAAGSGTNQASWLAQKLVDIYASLLSKIGANPGPVQPSTGSSSSTNTGSTGAVGTDAVGTGGTSSGGNSGRSGDPVIPPHSHP